MEDDSQSPARTKLNLSQKRALKAAEMQRFAAQYGRKAQKSAEPNDRKYDQEVARKISAMRPEELDHLLRDDEE